MSIKTFAFLVFLMIVVCSCTKTPKANDDLRLLMADKEFALKGDSLQQFHKILDKLDEKNEPFKKFIYHTFYEIQDSMDTVMPQSAYDTLSDTDKEIYALKKADFTTAAIEKYQKKFKISEKEEGILRYAFVLDSNVKTYCRQYITEASKGEISF